MIKQEENALPIRNKALEINLDPKIYGTIAEIGAGQEVARQFFRAGGASGTVAKAISAYDKKISDLIYGKEDSGRYVCESRVMKMLKREFNQITERLQNDRSEETQFFAYANTIATTGFQSQSEGHGWLAIRFQHEAQKEASEIVIHVVLKDLDAHSQQMLIGILGVNMVHSCFYKRKDMKELANGLLDHVQSSRVELDMIRTSGEAFEHIDDRLLALEMVKRSMTWGAFFDCDGQVIQPSDHLYKKNILVLRGSFRPPTLVSLDMLKCGLEKYAKLHGVSEDEIVPIAEITMDNLKSWGDIDGQDFLYRVELLTALGLKTMISSSDRHYRLSSFFRRFTSKPVGMVLGYYNLKEVLDEKHYKDLSGGILQSFGVLLNHEDTLLVYPYQGQGKKMLGVKDLEDEVSEKFKFLFRHLRENNLIVDLEQANKDLLHIYSRRVIDMIQNKTEGWEEMVPPEVVSFVHEKKLFTS